MFLHQQPRSTLVIDRSFHLLGLVQAPRFLIDPKALNLNLIRIFLCPIVAKRPAEIKHWPTESNEWTMNHRQ